MTTLSEITTDDCKKTPYELDQWNELIIGKTPGDLNTSAIRPRPGETETGAK